VAPASPIQVLEVAYGSFPRISALNPEFRDGVPRLKVTLRISDPEGGTPDPRQLLAVLREFLPSLGSHRCCGANSLDETFFEAGRRRHCAVEEKDDTVDIAHLIEHVIIDVQHFVGRMRVCSGVTCAYADPRDRYDVFVEAPEEAVGRACAQIAVCLMGEMIAGFRPDPRYLCVLELARLARDYAGQPIRDRTAALAAKWGPGALSDATEFLRSQGYLREIPSAFNFTGNALLGYLPARA
jgi:hypothetical protein